MPGERGVTVLNGSAYGVGIYLSPEASYSLGYSGLDYYSYNYQRNAGVVKLLVCAALPGRMIDACGGECVLIR